MSEFTNISDAELNATLAAIKDLPGTGAMVAAIKAEQDYRAENAEMLAQRAANVEICRAASETLAKIRHSTVTAISDPGGTVVKNARLTLVKLLSVTFDLSVHKAEKVVMVLSDDKGQTDVAGDIEKAVEYVNAHPTSTVYRQDDSNAPAAATESAAKAGEESATDSKPSK